MTKYVVEIEHTLHCTFEIEADDSQEAERLARTRLEEDLQEELDANPPIAMDFDVTSVEEV